MNWRDFWNGAHSIYVNERHSTLHYSGIARDIARLIPHDGAEVLDHGCGEALGAGEVAARCATLYLYDAAPNVQARLRARFVNEPRIIVLSTGALNVLGEAGLDLIVVNSLLQYLPMQELEALLDFWRGRLRPAGKLVIADIILPDVSAAQDVKALLTFAWQGGFFFAACRGLVATFFSPYRKLRGEIGLSTYSEEGMLTLLAGHGFKAERAAANIGHNGARMTFICVLK